MSVERDVQLLLFNHFKVSVLPQNKTEHTECALG